MIFFLEWTNSKALYFYKGQLSVASKLQSYLFCAYSSTIIQVFFWKFQVCMMLVENSVKDVQSIYSSWDSEFCCLAGALGDATMCCVMLAHHRIVFTKLHFIIIPLTFRKLCKHYSVCIHQTLLPFPPGTQWDYLLVRWVIWLASGQ